MKTLRIILGDQLSTELASLETLDPAHDIVLMMEVMQECTLVPHHKQKIVMILSAMRHFAQSLRQSGCQVDYITLDAPDNEGHFTGEVIKAVQRHKPERVLITAPSEWRVLRMVETWPSLCPCPVDILEDTRFFATPERFARWAKGRRQWRMEYFYREMRVEHHILMEQDQPIGGQWNYDQDNRKALPAQAVLPARKRFTPDQITADVIKLVDQLCPDHFGRLEEFGWPVTHDEALAALEDFITHALPHFGDYQDAMAFNHAFLFHSLLAPALNIGLLTPRLLCQKAQEAYHSGHAPLNAVEGFIRQILGWREYIRGIYWLLMPAYGAVNHLNANRPLPDFYWTGDTKMACLKASIDATRRHAYAHHIQRLMITGNFALLSGIAPQEVERWYLMVYADAFEWVEMPNTLGMALYADGGRLASKPYAASGAYINKMSDYCQHCAYQVKQKSGPEACPFNYLYWAFLIRNKQSLAGNPRLAMPYKTLSKWSEDQQAALLQEAEQFLDGLSSSAVET